MILPEKATLPTMYFIGVTTGKSSIMTLFPHWAKILGINAVIKGIDLPIHADPEDYRAVVDFIKNDPLSLGALVTTHKIDICNAAGDMFDYLDPYAVMFSELSSISKRDGRLEGYAKDPITSGLALEAFLPRDFWDRGGDAYIIGAGGSAISVGSYILGQKKQPGRLVVSNRSAGRLEAIEKLFGKIAPDAKTESYLAPEAEQADRILESLPPNSLIINATGLGKDRPGSPLSDACIFPEGSCVWEFNYRGDLRFMHQALEQAEKRRLHVEDGWIYFLHGWTQVIAEVFHIEITPEIFSEIEKKSAEICGRKR